MKRTVGIFSVIGLVLVILSLLGLVLCICGQKLLIPLYSSAEEVLSRFYVPAGSITYVFGILMAAILLLVGVNMESIAMEIIVPIVVFLAPLVQSLAHTWQIMFAKYYGSVFLAGLSAVNSVCNIPLRIGSLATIFIVLTCGMSIARKKMK